MSVVRLVSAIENADRPTREDDLATVEAYRRSLNERYLSTTTDRYVLAEQDAQHAKKKNAVRELAEQYNVTVSDL